MRCFGVDLENDELRSRDFAVAISWVIVVCCGVRMKRGTVYLHVDIQWTRHGDPVAEVVFAPQRSAYILLRFVELRNCRRGSKYRPMQRKAMALQNCWPGHRRIEKIGWSGWSLAG